VGILRKLAANTVLLFLLAPSFVWLAMPDSQSTLPACCRRDGKHHCAMMAIAEAGQEAPSLRAPSPQCPYRSLLGAPMGRSIAGPPIRFAFLTETVSHSDRIVQVHVSARVSEARSHLKRGPPALS
jgi:hypothetical protein